MSFASWERGSNENFNGFLRQYVTKNRSLNTVDEDENTISQKNWIKDLEKTWIQNTLSDVSLIFKLRYDTELNLS